MKFYFYGYLCKNVFVCKYRFLTTYFQYEELKLIHNKQTHGRKFYVIFVNVYILTKSTSKFLPEILFMLNTTLSQKYETDSNGQGFVPIFIVCNKNVISECCQYF